jgi:hypothetical protein
MDFKFFIGQVIVPNYNRHNTVWKMTNGRQVPIFYMTNNHIINTLGCFRGVGLTEMPEFYEGKTKQEWIEIFKTELRVREQENQQRV